MDELARGIQHTDVMALIAEIQAEGEPAADRRREVRNEGRSVFCFHRQSSYTQRIHCAGQTAFSSNLVRQHVFGHKLKVSQSF